MSMICKKCCLLNVIGINNYMPFYIYVYLEPGLGCCPRVGGSRVGKPRKLARQRKDFGVGKMSKNVSISMILLIYIFIFT